MELADYLKQRKAKIVKELQEENARLQKELEGKEFDFSKLPKPKRVALDCDRCYIWRNSYVSSTDN